MGEPDEDEQLRLAALQTSRSILRARMAAEESLRAQSELLRITLASIGDGMISIDAGGGVTFINGVAEKLTGWAAAEAIGKPVQEVFNVIHAQTGAPLPNPALQALRDGETVELGEHALLIARQGNRCSVEDSAAPMRDAAGATIGAVLIFRDVTERKRTDADRERLRAEVESGRERMRLLVENVTDYAIVITDPGRRIIEWNGGAELITGWSAQEAVGQSLDMIFTPADRSAGLPELETARAQAEGRADDKRWHLRKDGSEFFADGVMTALRGPGGELEGFGKLLRDATDRRRAEQALLDADRRKDEFIALLAHELRNPLAPIRNGLQVMRLAGDDAVALAQVRAMMERQLGHMVRLIDDLMDISRISQDRMELRRARVLLSEIVANAVETARPIIEAAGHQLTVSLPTAPVLLYADLTRLAQVLSNLLTNSAKYTERGGHIQLTGKRVGDHVELSVRDDGIGIPASALPRVFDMFSQVDRTTERSSGGLGIGLALVKGLVGMHGGSVVAHSDGPGMGSTFTLSLPALHAVDEADPTNAIEPAFDKARRQRRILVVDDNVDSADTLAGVLNFLGHQVQAAHDGIEAVAAAASFLPEVILMDVGMPRMGGYEAVRLIRQRTVGPRPLIIAVTGWGQDSDRAQSREAGCDGHLVKPVALGDVEMLIEQLDASDPD